MAGEVRGIGDLESRLLKTARSYEPEIVEFVEALIAIQTENPPGLFYRECCQVIANKLRELGLDYEVIEVPSDKPPASGEIAPEEKGVGLTSGDVGRVDADLGDGGRGGAGTPETGGDGLSGDGLSGDGLSAGRNDPSCAEGGGLSAGRNDPSCAEGGGLSAGRNDPSCAEGGGSGAAGTGPQDVRGGLSAGRNEPSCAEGGGSGAAGTGPQDVRGGRPGPRGSASRSGGKTSTRYCLLASHGSGKKTLYLHGHYDVVPASDKRQFAPRVENGAVFGRGSSDMKGGLASMIYAVRTLKTCGVPLDGRICVTFVPDEETGGALGSQYLSRIGVLGKDGVGMLTAEPTSGAIWNGSRGALSLRVTIRGKPAHVGLHYKGVNAFEQMLTVAQALVKLKSEVEARKTDFNISPENARRSILMIGGRSDGGTNFNVVPGRCSFTVDRRINPEESLEEEKSRLFAVFDALRHKGIDIEVDVLQEGESSGSPGTTPLALALLESVKEVRGRSPSIEMCPGLLETRFYARSGTPALAYGPGLLSVSHGPEEFVKVEDLRECAAVYALTAARILGVC